MRKANLQMIIFPAIDIKGGKCVRLLQGRAADATVYGDDPAEMAKRWTGKGCQYLHVVDLDGAFSGHAENLRAVEAIIKAAGVPVQLGGGIRTMEDIEQRFEMGVARVILGTAAVNDPQFAKAAVQRYGSKIVAGIDASDGKVAVKGWVEVTEISPADLARKFRSWGATACVYTDISRDGMLGGVNACATADLARKSGLNVIASGGVSSISDIRVLKSMGVYGAIIGKALYDGAVNLEEALKVSKE